MKVYVLTSEYSPELRADCGTSDLLGVYDEYNKAIKKARDLIDLADVYSVVDSYDYDNATGWSLYYQGDENSPYWYELTVRTKEVNGNPEF